MLLWLLGWNCGGGEAGWAAGAVVVVEMVVLLLSLGMWGLAAWVLAASRSAVCSECFWASGASCGPWCSGGRSMATARAVLSGGVVLTRGGLGCVGTGE